MITSDSVGVVFAAAGLTRVGIIRVCAVVIMMHRHDRLMSKLVVVSVVRPIGKRMAMILIVLLNRLLMMLIQVIVVVMSILMMRLSAVMVRLIISTTMVLPML